MKTRSVIAGAAIAVTAVAVGVYAIADHRPLTWPAAGIATTASVKSPSTASPPAQTEVSAPSLAPTTADASLRTSQDYFELARSLYPAAKGGDHQAQFELYQALKYCDDEFRAYFERRDRQLTLEEAMQRAARASPAMSVDDAREVFARCQRLKDKSLASPPFGDSDDWLLAASNGGYPLAQITLAEDLFMESGAGGEITDIAKREEAKRLAAEALRSKDPAVLWKRADLVLMYSSDTTGESQEQWVWQVAACQRGYDCSASAEWHKWYCRFDYACQPYETVLDYIRRVRSEDFDEIEQKARDLNARLDAESAK